MKVLEIRKMSVEDLTKTTNDLRVEIAELRRRVRLGEVSNVRIVRQRRKDLARVLTVLSEELIKETK
ncbi:50S ribosomal protein L29 [bacterium]|nr:50S ribosomal protein L29 [bacterium]